MGVNASLLSALVLLKSLQSLDFHHYVKTLLFFDIIGFEFLRLLELLISDGNYLRVEYHLVHVLDVVVLFIELLLGL